MIKFSKGKSRRIPDRWTGYRTRVIDAVSGGGGGYAKDIQFFTKSQKYEWKARVAVDQEEPEDFEWAAPLPGDGAGSAANGIVDDEMDGGPDDGQSNDSEEEEELEEVLGNGGDQTPDATPRAGPGTPMVEES